MKNAEPKISRDLLRQTAQWRLIALLLSRPHPGWAEQVLMLSSEAGDENLRLAAQAAQPIASAGLYDTTFGPGGPAAPREVSYRACLDGNFLAQLSGLYRAFAYEHDTDEPPDHVAVQAGFIAYLALKQLYAHARGACDHGDAAARAAALVMDEHLRVMAAPLARSLHASGIDYLARASAALLDRVGESPRMQLSMPVLNSPDDDSSTGCAFEADDAPAAI
jgi:hypothetical protein